jgi:hypothetical protein
MTGATILSLCQSIPHAVREVLELVVSAPTFYLGHITLTALFERSATQGISRKHANSNYRDRDPSARTQLSQHWKDKAFVVAFLTSIAWMERQSC